ncbi:MAG: sn-glycerol-3-phosphate ABC transporter ATP-binding protein UgpC [Burkholderiaceae bacterium]
MATVELRNVKKRFGKTEVVHGVDLTIEDGEFVVIVGPSGCGKSTLLRMVAGLETVSEGEILIDGQIVNKLEPKDRNIAMVFQNYALYPHMNVFDNMAYGLKNRKLDKAEIREKVERAAQTLELDGLLKRKPSELSGGQRQRVAMGRAIVRSPKVFLFDEPLSNLDAKLRVNMRIEIRRLQRELGITSLYVTHDQVEAMTLADRLVAMNAGLAEQVGRPTDIYKNPASQFVGGFIGSPAMNFLPAESIDGQLRIGETLIPTEPTVSLPEGKITIGIRPEHLDIVDATSGVLTGTIDLVEPLGAETLVHVRIANAAAESPLVTVRISGLTSASVDAVVGLNPEIGQLRYFDADGAAVSTESTIS